MLADLFFQLIQTAIVGDPRANKGLSRVPTSKEWGELYVISKKQTLHGVCFYGIQLLPRAQTANLPEVLKLRWLGSSVSIQQRNGLMNRKCVELLQRFATEGIEGSILKGQGVAMCYPLSLRTYREPGDIDIFVDASREQVIRYAQSLGDGQPEWDYKHLHLKIFAKIEVEVHYVPEVLLNIWKNRKLQRWFKEHREWMFANSVGSTTDDALVTPTLAFNLFYILLHTYRHFLYEGVGLRQLMDYYFVLKAYRANVVDDEAINDVVETIKAFGMTRFTRGVLWVLNEVFEGGHSDSQCITLGAIEPDENEGRYILNQIMIGGNFGHYDERLKSSRKGKFAKVTKVMKHNLYLLSHYPSDVVWTPLWIAWHCGWKKVETMKLR